MKVLIFVLLAALTAEAQSIADAARMERARRAQAKTARVFTTADVKSGSAAEPAAPSPAPSSELTAAKPSTTAKAETNARSPEEILQEWVAQMERIRAAIRALQDQETALQLQVNDFTNQVYAPVTTLGARSQAQANLADVQSKLVEVRKELARTRLMLQQMEAQGLPKSK